MERALALISADKRAAVGPVFEEIFGFYGTVAMGSIDNSVSDFTRGLASFTPPIAQPVIRIATNHDFESAFVHELLHLYLPLRYGAYALYFPKLTAEVKELSDGIQNIVEHDLMINLYLDFGYPLEQFQVIERRQLSRDYRREKLIGNGPPYWMFEYLCHLFWLRHYPKSYHEAIRASMGSMRKLALGKYPGLATSFQLMRQWVEARAYHEPAHYPRELKALFAIFRYGIPEQYMKPETDKLLSTHPL